MVYEAGTMMLNWKVALPIGLAIGVAAALPIAFMLSAQSGKTGENNIRDDSIKCESEECLSFYIWGIVRDISDDSMTVVQSNQTESHNNSSITIAKGPRLLWCGEDGRGCDQTAFDKIPLGTLACAHARLNPDGSFAVDTIFFNTVCTTQIQLNSEI
jgi:hypothetical protein